MVHLAHWTQLKEEPFFFLQWEMILGLGCSSTEGRFFLTFISLSFHFVGTQFEESSAESELLGRNRQATRDEIHFLENNFLKNEWRRMKKKVVLQPQVVDERPQRPPGVLSNAL